MSGPQTLTEYVGQEQIKNNLNVILTKLKAQPYSRMPHTLFTGPPGLGKTSLAELMSKEMGVPIIKVMGPHIKESSDLDALKDAEPKTILFIDEIHSLPLKVEESLYEAMDYMTFRGSYLNRFTLIGATTKEGALSRPLLSRFTIVERLQPYTHNDICQIIQAEATQLGLVLSEESSAEIARRSRGTPRIAKQLLKRISYYSDNITLDSAQNALDSIGVDKFGLELLDRVILRTMKNSFGGGPVGISSLANVVGEDAKTIDSREHYLVAIGFIQRTGRGRVLTDEGSKYLA